jgi:hypothetical protein
MDFNKKKPETLTEFALIKNVQEQRITNKQLTVIKGWLTFFGVITSITLVIAILGVIGANL